MAKLCNQALAQVRVVWYGGKVLLIALMLLGQFSSQWGKEDKELLSNIVPPVDKDIEELHKSGVILEEEEKRYELKFQFLRSMNDRKMQKLLLGRGGAFCFFSDQDSVSVEQIKEGFEMENVDIVTLKAFYECLKVDEVSKHRGDYDERMGLTQDPITSFDVHTFPIPHALLEDHL